MLTYIDFLPNQQPLPCAVPSKQAEVLGCWCQEVPFIGVQTPTRPQLSCTCVCVCPFFIPSLSQAELVQVHAGLQ